MTSSVEDESRMGSQFGREPRELEIRDLWISRRSHWLLVLALGVLGLLLAIFATLRSPTLYTATADVELRRDISGVGLKDFSGTAAQTGTGPEFMLDLLTLQEIMSDDQTAESVIDALGLMREAPYSSFGDVPGKLRDASPSVRDRAIKTFKSGLMIAPVKNTRLLAVSYTDKSPDRASIIANEVYRQYVANSSKARTLENTAASNSLKAQIADLQKHIEKSHAEVADLEERTTGIIGAPPLLQAMNTGSYDPDANNSPAYERLKTLNAELTRIQMIRLAKEAVYHMTEQSDDEVVQQVSGAHIGETIVTGSALDAGSRSIQLIQSLHQQETALEVKLASDRVQYGVDNPVVLHSRKQIDEIRSQIHREVLHIKSAAHEEYVLALTQENALRNQVAKQQSSVGQMSSNIARLALLQQDETTSRQLYQGLNQKLQEAAVQSDVQSSDAELVDPSQPPSSPSSPILRKNLLIGLAAGLLIGYIIALFLKLREALSSTRERVVIAS